MKSTLAKQEILERLKIASNSSSDADLARFLGVAPATLSNWKARGSLDYDLVFSKCEHINLDWLLVGRGSMMQEKTEKPTVSTLPKLLSNQGIPLIPVEAIAGVLSGNSTAVMEYECDRYDIPMFRGADFLIYVCGDSMQPKYFSGDLVACKRLPVDTFFQWNKVYVIDSEQGVIIKRIRPGSDNRHVVLVSENVAYAPFELPLEKIYSIALVIGVVRAE